MRIRAPWFVACLVVSMSSPFTSFAQEQPAESAAAAAGEEITVTGRRGLGIGESPLSSSLLTQKEVRAFAARTPDDALRGIASVGTPRAGSSLQHPTAQGVSMRGVGNGRTLVLLDGIPVNDAFGGWIQWNKMPLSALHRVEVVRGAAANAWGSLAMGGAIQLFRAPALDDGLDVDASYGQLDTYRVFAEGTKTVGDAASVTLLGHAFRSGGAYVVAPELRGPVDQPERFESKNASARVDLRLSGETTAFASAGYYGQAGTTGTQLSANSLWIAEGAAGLDFRPQPDTLVRARVFGSDQRYDNVNTRIAAGRTGESVAVRNHVPALRLGGSLLWSRAWDRRHALTFGLDAQHSSATNRDALFNAQGASTGTQTAGGSQALLGAFAEWSFTPVPSLTTTAGIRADLWDNYAGSTTSAAGVAASLPEKRQGAITPRLAAVYRISPDVAVRGAAYAGFRAPNRNELYRGYLSGGVTTLPNPALGAERLAGAEVGADVSPAKGVRLGITGYVNALSDLIQSVTLDAQTRQRQNVAQARALGIEADARWRALQPLTLTASYALTRSRVVSSPANPALVGLRLPATPLHRGAVGAILDLPDLFRASARAWAESTAFADDRNTFRLPEFAQLDLSLSRALTREVEVQASMTNSLDARIVTGRDATVTNVAAPRTVWVAVRGGY